MSWVDSHCHLEVEDFPDTAGVLERARSAGLCRAVAVGQFRRPGDFGNALALARTHPDFVVATMGIHPHDAAAADESDFETLARLCAESDVVAVGETGLDYHYDRSPRAVQKAAFARQCAIARGLGKPLVVHVRDAHADCAELLQGEKMERGVIHCFTGDLQSARRYLDLGFFLSLSGVLTYKKTDALREAVQFTPLDRLMVETDSPFLSPVPYRGKKNEPAFVVETGKKLAELKALPVEQVAESTTQNALAMFSCNRPSPGIG